MSILAWLVLGLIAGAVARLLHPGTEPGGIVTTLLVGVAGAFLGGFIGQAVFHRGISGFDLPSFLLAVAGAFLLLVIYRFAMSRRGTTTPTTTGTA